MMKSLVGSGLALAVAAAVWSPILTSAQQVKGGQLLIAHSAPVSAVAMSPAPAMSCPLCKDEFTSRLDTNARGAIKPVVTVQKHLCPTCKTSLKTVGMGKQATQVVVHTCTMGGNETASCCK